jgi:hypothetical protein
MNRLWMVGPTPSAVYLCTGRSNIMRIPAWLAPFVLLSLSALGQAQSMVPQMVEFPSGKVHLKAYFWKPVGAGPFPAVLFNHGSGGADADHTAGLPITQSANVLAPFFIKHGYAFLYPFRRGHGPSASQAPFMQDLLRREEESRGKEARQHLQFVLLTTDDNVMAALAFLKTMPVASAGCGEPCLSAAVNALRLDGIDSILSSAVGFRAPAFCILIPWPVSPLRILGKSRMRKRARTDLCGGRPAMSVPTATVIERFPSRRFVNSAWCLISCLPTIREPDWVGDTMALVGNDFHRALRVSTAHTRLGLLTECLPKISRHVAHKAMHRYLCDTVADNRVHGLPYSAEGRLVNAGEIQLRFGRSQRIHEKFALHEREQARHFCGLPFQRQLRGRD